MFAQARWGAKLKISSLEQIQGTDLEPTRTPNLVTFGHARRSTRLFQSLRLSISGQNRIGNPVVELASAVAVNCHGCLYSSRYDYRLGSWVTLEAVNQQVKGKLQPIRAQVKFVGLPRSPRELYRVGVELETPANIWGIKSPPEDWLPGSVNAAVDTRAIASAPDSQVSAPTEREIHALPTTEVEVCGPISPGTIELTLQASTSAPGAGKQVRILVSSDQLLHALEGKLQQAAEKAVASAVAGHLNTAVTAAVKAIENAGQMSLRNVEEQRVRDRQTLLNSPRVGLLGRLKADLANAGERLQKQIGASFARAPKTAQHFENSAREVGPVLVEVRPFSDKLAAGQIEVQAGGDARYQVHIDTTKMLNAVVVGSFRASGGSRNDIAVVLAAEDEFENWINGHQANVLFATDRVTTGRLNVPITHSGTYILAFNNRFSLLARKTVAADIELRYCTQR